MSHQNIVSQPSRVNKKDQIRVAAREPVHRGFNRNDQNVCLPGIFGIGRSIPDGGYVEVLITSIANLGTSPPPL